MAFQQGLSGLNAASKALDVTSNNVSNSGTVGFKSGQAHFADFYANSLNGSGTSQTGIGTTTTAVQQQFTQGNITSTNNALDISINGSGFYRMNTNGAITYSRAGQFHLDKSGYVIDDQQRKLTGYLADSEGVIVKAAPQDLLLSSANQAPAATGASGSAKQGVFANLNFDSRVKAPTIAFDKDKPASYNFSTATAVYDTLGNAHTYTIYAVKTDTPESTAATAAASASTLAADSQIAAAAYETAAKAAEAAAIAANALANPTAPAVVGSPSAIAAAASNAASLAARAVLLADTAQAAALKASTAATAAVTASTSVTAASAAVAETAAATALANAVAAQTSAAKLKTDTAAASALAAADVASGTTPPAAATATALADNATYATGTALVEASGAVGFANAPLIPVPPATVPGSVAAAKDASGIAAANSVISTWSVYTSVDGTSINNVNSGVPEVLSFNQSGRLVNAPVGGSSVTIDLNAVMASQATPQANIAQSPLVFQIDFADSTQFGSAFGTNSLTQDGYTSGRLTGVSVSEDGIISGNYSNGKTRNLGQVALASFTNPNGLTSLGGNQWAETDASGSPAVGSPNSGTLGVLKSSTIEESNVDLTAELVNMITQQRAYQASAQTIKTQDQIMNTLVNLR